jgi:hypothetical protein
VLQLAAVVLNDIHFMQLWMILGGLLGFLIGVGFGLSQSTAWSTILWRACVAACLAGFVFRWWGSVWVNSLHQAQQEQWAAPAKPPIPVTAAKTRV